MTRIALDVMGGDLGVEQAIQAAVQLSNDRDVHIILVGDAPSFTHLLPSSPVFRERLSIHHTPDWVTMNTPPKIAVATQPRASIFEATRLVQEGSADVTVTTGNTGAAVMACAKHFERLPGVRRGAIAAVFPTSKSRGATRDPFALILDSGATLDADAKDLVIFALLGSAYARCISKNDTPKVALLSNGTEPMKGRKAVVAAHDILKSMSKIEGLDFIGNIEGVHIPKGTADVIVTDGFTGNIVLKLLEGMGDTMANLIRDSFRGRLSWRIGLVMLHKRLRQVRSATDWRQYGGAPILGFEHLLIKAHGRSDSRAILNALKVADKCVRSELTRKMKTKLLNHLGALN